MRLLNVNTFVLYDIPSDHVPQYAILSHTWGGQEVTLKDLEDESWKSREDKREGREKIQGACAVAAAEGFEYIWIDTCCINKWSSSELSEAINSMFRWYSESAICYAYLADVFDNDASQDQLLQFGQSRWFSRGWTLQELLAPAEVVFLNHDWIEIGSKATLGPTIKEVTRISGDALASRSWTTFSVAQKMSWAADRQTTRLEDRAYCLLGLFGINIPLLYGEGDRAFFRLQEEIIKRFDDESIFAWSYPPGEQSHASISGILAPSPNYFKDAGAIAMESSRRKGMEMGKDTADEYFLNTFELVRQLVRLRMPVLGPLRGIELDPASPGSHTKQLESVSADFNGPIPRGHISSTLDRGNNAGSSTGAGSENQNDHSSPHEEDDAVPRLILTAPDGEGMYMPSDDTLSANDEDAHEATSLQVGPRHVEEDPDTFMNWRWFIYEPIIIVPLLCSQHGQHIGITLAVSQKEGRALYRVHNPSLLMKKDMISTFSTHRQLRTLYVNGISLSENQISGLPDKKDEREVRIAQLLSLGYSTKEEASAKWEFLKAAGILRLRKQEQEQPHLIIFEHRTDADSPSFYVEFGFENPVVGVFEDSSFPRVAHSIPQNRRRGSRVEVPMLETGKSIVFKWRHTKNGQLLDINIEESRLTINDKSLELTSGGRFNMRLALTMRNGLGRKEKKVIDSTEGSRPAIWM